MSDKKYLQSITLPSTNSNSTANQQYIIKDPNVPIPTSSDINKFLKGDGTWAEVSGGSGLQYVHDSSTAYGVLLNSTENIATGFAVAEGHNTTASGDSSHAEGQYTKADINAAHAEGIQTTAQAGSAAHAEGKQTLSRGNASHAEGQGTTAGAAHGHSQGLDTYVGGYGGHAEGHASTAMAYAHAEGQQTKALGQGSHTEGYLSVATAMAAHAEGNMTTAEAPFSHVEGLGSIAAGDAQHVTGRYNIKNYTYLEIVGNGNSSLSRSNARTLDQSGNEWIAGNSTVAGGNLTLGSVTIIQPTEANKFLLSDGTWQRVSSGSESSGGVDTTYSLSISTAANSTLKLIDSNNTTSSVVIPNTTNTTYGSMSTAEGVTGTATSNRVLTAKNLKNIVNNLTSSLNTSVTNLVNATSSYQNVQADWNVTATNSDSYIKNKPTIPTIPDVVTTSTNGLMSSTDKSKLNSYPSLNNSSTQFLSGDGTWKTVSSGSGIDNDSTYSLTQNSTDKHKLIWEANGANPVTFTIPDNNTTYDLSTITGTLPVNRGGTGATNASGARTNLGAAGTSTVTTSANGLMSSTDKSKLDALVTATASYQNVQSDWNITATNSYAFIKNKPTIPTVPGTFTTAANGLVPKPAAAATNTYLNSSGTWTTPPNTTYSLNYVHGLNPTTSAPRIHLTSNGSTVASIILKNASTASNGLVPSCPQYNRASYILNGYNRWVKPQAVINETTPVGAVVHTFEATPPADEDSTQTWTTIYQLTQWGGDVGTIVGEMCFAGYVNVISEGVVFTVNIPGLAESGATTATTLGLPQGNGTTYGFIRCYYNGKNYRYNHTSNTPISFTTRSIIGDNISVQTNNLSIITTNSEVLPEHANFTVHTKGLKIINFDGNDVYFHKRLS